MSQGIFQSWGLKPAEGTVCWWGARAIYRSRCIDLLHDRSGFTDLSSDPLDGSNVQKLNEWLTMKGLPYLRSFLEHSADAPMTDERRNVVVSGDGYTLRANPNGSYGYLYIVAHVDATATDPTPKPLKAKRIRAATLKRKPSVWRY